MSSTSSRAGSSAVVERGWEGAAVAVDSRAPAAAAAAAAVAGSEQQQA